MQGTKPVMYSASALLWQGSRIRLRDQVRAQLAGQFAVEEMMSVTPGIWVLGEAMVFTFIVDLLRTYKSVGPEVFG